MGILLFLLGFAVTAAVVFDFLKTTIGMAGLGPLTLRLSDRLWRVAQRVVPRIEGPERPRYTDAVGPVIVSLVALMWITLNCLGYTLMFAASDALVDKAGEPAGVIERVAFAGVSLSTLGASIVDPGNGWWNALAMVAAVNGMIVLTLSVSFVMNVLQTTAAARALALRVGALDARSEAMDRPALEAGLAALGPALAHVVMELRGAPIVGYFCTRERAINFALAVLTLCDLVEARVSPERPGDEPAGLSELRDGLRELSELDGTRPTGLDAHGLDATRAWARRRLIPHPG